MRAVQIQFNQWDRPYNFDPVDLDLEIGEDVIVKTELGMEMGEVVSKNDITEAEAVQNGELKPVLRRASAVDLEKRVKDDEKKKALELCKRLADKFELPMKLVDVCFSFDGSRMTFAFIADGRVDFRELVKELTKHFNRTIRLQQIGIRDEAKLCGDCGHCGMPLCCGRFLRELSSVTSEMAELQQVAHRGSERISGVCGRLMCCLGYEENGYESLSKNMPPIDSIVTFEGKKGRVAGWHVLKQTIDFEYSDNGEGRTIIEADVKKVKK